jgi:hypothetical protein
LVPNESFPVEPSMSLLSDMTALPLFHFSAFSPLLVLCLLNDLFFVTNWNASSLKANTVFCSLLKTLEQWAHRGITDSGTVGPMLRAPKSLEVHYNVSFLVSLNK